MDQIVKKASEEVAYNSEFSIFMRTASDDERRRVFLEAARRATEEQREVIRRASMK